MLTQTHLQLDFKDIFAIQEPSSSKESQSGPQIVQNPRLQFPESSGILDKEHQINTLSRHQTSAGLTSSNNHKTTNSNNSFSFLRSDFPQRSVESTLLSRAVFSRREPATKIAISTITQRLSQSKKYVNRLSVRKSRQSDAKIEQQSYSKSTIKNKSRQLPQGRGGSRSQSTFQHLYNHSKARQLYDKYLAQPISHKSSIPKGNRRNKKVKAAKKCTSFDGFDQNVAQSLQKIKRLDGGLGYCLKQQRSLFKPILFPSRIRQKTSSRYRNVNQNRSKPNKIQAKVESSPQKKIIEPQIASCLQEYFINKMSCIFIKENADLVQITEDIIEMLTQTQFEILSVFIMYIQDNPIRPEQFYPYLYSYYQSLTSNQQVQLSQHYARKRTRYPKEQTWKNKNTNQNLKLSKWKQSQLSSNQNMYFSPKINQQYHGAYLYGLERFV